MENYNMECLNDNELESINKDLYKINQILLDKVNEQTINIKNKFLKDELTGLGNLNKYNLDLEKFKYDKLAVFDITNFKSINNLYGNDLGDKVVVVLSKKFINHLEKLKLKVYSFYIDMFAVGAEVNVTKEDFILCMEQLHLYINTESFFVDKYEVCLNTNTVLAFDVEYLQEKAFLTLDYLKEIKDSFLIYSADLKLEEEIENNFYWIRKIKKAIDEDKVVPYYQPIYNNKTNKIDKFEALIRLIDEEGNVIEPKCFLDISKKTNLYKKLTKIMVEKTFSYFENIDYAFSINITVEDILDSQTREYILFKLQFFSKPNNVIFELVETESIEQYIEIGEFIRSAKNLGAKIAIDDFGTGYSNLMYLIQLDVDIIKIDGSIIKNMHLDEHSNLIANTVMYLANNLNIETIAEFVEDEKIFDKVKDIGIHHSQGYYFSKPKKDIKV